VLENPIIKPLTATIAEIKGESVLRVPNTQITIIHIISVKKSFLIISFIVIFASKDEEIIFVTSLNISDGIWKTESAPNTSPKANIISIVKTSGKIFPSNFLVSKKNPPVITIYKYYDYYGGIMNVCP
jgi:hypothetical protein